MKYIQKRNYWGNDSSTDLPYFINKTPLFYANSWIVIHLLILD